ncbi:MAG: glycine--tRNA ligase subunit beta [Croceibacterium sp.]
MGGVSDRLAPGVTTVARDFLLELRCEEIPARMQAGGHADLERLFREHLKAAGVSHGALTVWSTPRRLALIVRDVPPATEAVREELKGPRTSAPPQALDGFLRKTGLTEGQLETRGDTYFAVIERPGRATTEVLAWAIAAIVRVFPWPKSMRWGAASLSTDSPRWVRPLSGIVAILGEDLVPVTVGDIASGYMTLGHRFHHPGPITIGGASDYQEKLRACHVIVDHEERQDLIRIGATKAAADAGLAVVADEGLVIENAGLTEWPVPLLGRFDPSFLEVPPEVIQLTTRINQKYFVCHRDGKLVDAFVCTANIEASDGGAAIVDGNRKVLAARLSDARFFWYQDRKKTLAQHAEGLARITFHEKLGTVADKVERVAKLARWLVEEGIVKSALSPSDGQGECSPQASGGGAGGSAAADAAGPSVSRFAPATSPSSPGDDREDLANLAEQAARLCKADLVTAMVGEFPELQGVMGGYYARAEGLPDEVADAIRDHYKPAGQGDDVPSAPVTVAVSLADKLDSLARFFAAGMPPTGSKDPFALRRSGIGLLALILENGLRVPLVKLLEQTGAATSYQPVEDFLIDRLKVQQREAGVRHDLIDAVFALGGEDDLVRLLARVHALQTFISTEDGANLLVGYKRTANILKKEDWQGETQKTLSYMLEPAEQVLIEALDAAEPRAAAAVREEDFAGAMAALASLRAPIDRFFEQVTVNDSESAKRSARLALLARFRAAVHNVADFSRIEG